MSTSFYFENKEEREKRLASETKSGEKIKNIMVLVEDLVEDSEGRQALQSQLESWVGISDVSTLPIGTRLNGKGAVLETTFDYDSVAEMKEWYEKNKSEWVIVEEGGIVLDWETLHQKLLQWANIDKSGGRFGADLEDEDGYLFNNNMPF